MCPGPVPGNRSDTVSERSTTLILASSAKSISPPQKPSAGAGFEPAATAGSSLSKRFEVPLGIETQLFGVSDHLDLRVSENFVDHVFRNVEVLEVKRVRDADEARLCGGNAPVTADGRPKRFFVV